MILQVFYVNKTREIRSRFNALQSRWGETEIIRLVFILIIRLIMIAIGVVTYYRLLGLTVPIPMISRYERLRQRDGDVLFDWAPYHPPTGTMKQKDGIFYWTGIGCPMIEKAL